MERLALKNRKSVRILFLLVVSLITLIAVGTAIAIPDTEYNIDKDDTSTDDWFVIPISPVPLFVDDPTGDFLSTPNSSNEDIINTWIARGSDSTLNFLMELNASPPLSDSLYRGGVYLDCDDDGDTDYDPGDMIVLYDPSDDVVAVYTGDTNWSDPTALGTAWGQPVGAYLEWGIPLSKLPPNNPDLPDQPDCEINSVNPGEGTLIGFFVVDVNQEPARKIDITEERGYDIPGGSPIVNEAVADFEATPTSGLAPLNVDFTNTSTGDYDTCSWVFGDGGTSSECVPPIYTYSMPGVYDVSLTVSGYGIESTETKTNYITVRAVVADFSATPTSGVESLDVDFTNTSRGVYDTCSWDFGDGGTSGECEPSTYTYNTHGVYTVSLTVSGGGEEDTKTKTDYITVNEAVADFEATPTSGYVPLDVDFTNTSTIDYDTCNWVFGDGGTSSECAPPTYTYSTSGVYDVSLTVSGDGKEDTETKMDYITVIKYDEAQADFSATPTSGIAPLDVDFTNSSTGDYDTCSWDYGDGGSSSVCSPPTYTYNTPGLYTVSLTVSGDGGEDTETKTDYITVYEKAQAAFSATPTSGVAPLDVDFTNQSSGDYDTCSWDFGDGGASSECAPPTHTYNSPGVYTVALTVSGGNGGEDTETKTDYITVDDPAQADFSATPTSGVAPLDVDFTNNSTGDYDTCSWDFGDSGTSSECAPPTYTYNTPGVYTVSLTISGGSADDTETKTDYITVYEEAQADFSAAPTSGVEPLDVDFTNQSSGDYDTCSWDFGDGGNSSVCAPPKYTYNTPGVYTVSLTVSGNGGEDTKTKTDYVTVYEVPQANFIATPTSGAASMDVDFANTSTGDYDTCSWDFGDGGTSSVCSPPTYTYNTPGIYTVSLTVSGNGGEDTETKTDYITVYEAAQADFSATPISGVAPLTVDFNNMSSGDYDTCSWDFGDGATYVSCGKLSHIYSEHGVYTVTLTVSGNGGEDTESKVDHIVIKEYYYSYMPIIMGDNPGAESTNIIQSVVDFLLNLLP